MIAPGVTYCPRPLVRRMIGVLAGLGLLVSSFGIAANAQSFPSSESNPPKYWILFDSRSSADLDGAAHSPAVTERARQRRTQRGTVPPRRFNRPPPRASQQALSKLGIEPLVTSRWLNAVSAPLTPDQLDAVKQLPNVRDVRPVGRLRASGTQISPRPFPLLPSTTAPRYGLAERQLAAINAIAPLERGIDGSGVRIGFLDTEFGQFQHPVFNRLQSEERLIAIHNFTGRSQRNRHGRSVASVAVGFTPDSLVGPGHGAEVLGATTEYVPFERNQEEDYFVAGLEWLEAQGADVVNVSLGYTTFDAGERSYTPDDLDGDTGVTTRAVDVAAALGVVVVVSAGNAGGCAGPDSCWYFIGTPADADSAIAVGAVAPDSTRSLFSSFGPTADGRIKPDVAAPGQLVTIAASNRQYALGSGTSFASPLVTGVVAQMLQVNPELTPIQVRTILRQTASQADRPDNALGWGIVNAEAAIQEAERLREDPPDEPIVAHPYPNPTSDQVTFKIRMPAETRHARLVLYNMLGQRVATRPLALRRGTNYVSVNTSVLSSGLYVYRIDGDQWNASGKLTVVH